MIWVRLTLQKDSQQEHASAYCCLLVLFVLTLTSAPIDLWWLRQRMAGLSGSVVPHRLQPELPASSARHSLGCLLAHQTEVLCGPVRPHSPHRF